MRGLSITLLERRTIGWGTSSRSSRLIHGGIRYLEMGDLGLVREALRERGTLLRIAPDLVHGAPFLFILDRGAWWQWLRIGIGVVLYRILAGKASLGPHHPLTRAGIIGREPLLAQAPLIGGALYQDARGDDIGLVRANAASARAAGATILENVEAAVRLLPDGVGVEATLPQGQVITARTLVIAAGPWTDRVRGAIGLPERHLVGGTKGVHITIDAARLPLGHALALRHPDDQRVMFCIPEPEHGHVLVGTTDTVTDEPPDALTVGEDDIAYLLRAVQHLFPALGLGRGDVADAWAGVRPLLDQRGTASSRSREHLLLREGCVLTMAGGKLTTYRAQAEEAVDETERLLGRRVTGSRTAEVALTVNSERRTAN
jgi:glycerol-3-phosphate dehydrogenase